NAIAPVAAGGVGYPFAIGRPDWRSGGNRSESKPSAEAARQILYPDVVFPGVNLERKAIALWGKLHLLQVGELVGDRANLLTAAIHPNQLQIGVSSTAKDQQSIFRGRGVHVPGAGVVHHTFHQAAGFATQRSLRRIE